MLKKQLSSLPKTVIIVMSTRVTIQKTFEVSLTLFSGVLPKFLVPIKPFSRALLKIGHKTLVLLIPAEQAKTSKEIPLKPFNTPSFLNNNTRISTVPKKTPLTVPLQNICTRISESLSRKRGKQIDRNVSEPKTPKRTRQTPIHTTHIVYELVIPILFGFSFPIFSPTLARILLPSCSTLSVIPSQSFLLVTPRTFGMTIGT